MINIADAYDDEALKKSTQQMMVVPILDGDNLLGLTPVNKEWLEKTVSKPYGLPNLAFLA